MEAAENSVAALADNACVMPWEDKSPFSARQAFKQAVTPELFVEMVGALRGAKRVLEIALTGKDGTQHVYLQSRSGSFVAASPALVAIDAALSKALGLEGEQG